MSSCSFTCCLWEESDPHPTTISSPLSLFSGLLFSLCTSQLLFNKIHTIDFGVWSHLPLNSGRGISYNHIITPSEIFSVLCQEFCPQLTRICSSDFCHWYLLKPKQIPCLWYIMPECGKKVRDKTEFTKHIHLKYNDKIDWFNSYFKPY